MNAAFARPALALTAVVVLALAGCGGDSDQGSATAHGGGHGGGDSTTSPSAEFNSADVAFVAGMKPHHEQAVEMAEIILAADPPPDVARLAQQIKAAQAPEVEQLDAMLKTFGAEAEGGHDAEAGHSGMMSPEAIEGLEAAEGADASRMFLEMMIDHHEGAIAAAEIELAGGKYRPALRLAAEIARTQAKEIATMLDLLAKA